MPPKAPIKIFSGTQTRYLAEEIGLCAGRELGNVNLIHFSDGEFATAFEETVRGSHVFIIQSTFPPSDNLFELLMLIDAAKRASAYKIIAVSLLWVCSPGSQRSTQGFHWRQIGGRYAVYSRRVSRVITMDLHADQIQGFFNLPVDHLYASGNLCALHQTVESG
jgi:ribose-phosphate pyrophosphokinase